ncbi:hypothetical protein KJ845_03205, partial [Patescibacteria group bacterium]|nr:hypothetical protein [Patescibacteria group bacterium]
MQYNFKKFQNTHGRYEGRITITASNSIGFPTKFFKENNIANYKYVVLYFDEQERALGIQFSNSDEEQHKFSLIKSNQGYGGSTVATSFFKKYEIDTKIHKGKYD